jgi:hypothetical protein
MGGFPTDHGDDRVQLSGGTVIARPLRTAAVRAATVLVVATALLALALIDPALSGWFPGCIFHELTGLFCPGCGTTRAMHALLSGAPLTALSFNPLATAAAPFLAYAGARWLVAPWSGRRLPAPELHPSATRLVPGVVLVFWLLRNLEPFGFLAPGGS